MEKITYDQTPKWIYNTNETPIHHVSISSVSTDVAISLWNGMVQILSPNTGRISYALKVSNKDSIITSSKFHPQEPNILLSVSSFGKISLFKFTENKTLFSFNEDNNIYTTDFSSDGTHFITAGKDKSVRIYETKTQNLIKLKQNNSSKLHSSRIYSVVNDENPNIFYSAGWDSRVLQWDIRAGESVQSFGGPFICGDSIDSKGTFLLTGSWRQKRPLEIWDTRNGECVSFTDWSNSDFCQLYAAKFCKGHDLVVAGGSECSFIQAFNLPKWNPKQRIGMFKDTVNSIAISNDAELIVAVSQGGACFGFKKQ